MADKCDLCLLGLIVLSSLLSGSSGVADDDHVFISSGGNVRLSCNNALSNCTSTTWIYNRFRHSAAVELIRLGMKKNNTERHESLSLGSDCSLNINNVTIEDRGVYTCRQYVNGQQQGPDACVHLHVLHVFPSSSSSSSSSSETEISPGRSVTLSCQLYSDPQYSCDDWVRSEDIELLWVNQAGVDLQTDSRYQISAPDRCNITLTTTLLNEDHNREWRCEVTQRKQLKTSVTHTVKSSGESDRTTATHTPVFTAQVIVSIVEMAVFAAPTVILLQIICARRAGRKDSQRPEEIEMPTI
ncbi:carcinoembryonic antigen-related cell adhesion molecule 2-like [Pseudorasbora parva]|uniref:carcinoembryonic antigen-related cell adhesion molecule 2-like n=1 Tax=Pseudorasbora parva TaxID=51549 RepID=UPI00351DBA41